MGGWLTSGTRRTSARRSARSAPPTAPATAPGACRPDRSRRRPTAARWRAAVAAQLDEVRALLRRLREQDAVVGDDAHRHALDLREAAHQRRAEARLELVELGVVDDAGDDLAHVEGLAVVGRDDPVQLPG